MGVTTMHRLVMTSSIPTVGGLYWINNEIGIFANYAQSIESPSGTERTPIAEIAPPELGEGIEFGLRFDLLSGKLDGQFAYYSITKENDNEFAYSTRHYSINIYPGSIYGVEFPENYFGANNDGYMKCRESCRKTRCWRQDSLRRCRIRLHL